MCIETQAHSFSYIYPQLMKLPFCLKLGPNKIETLSPSTFGLTYVDLQLQDKLANLTFLFRSIGTVIAVS